MCHQGQLTGGGLCVTFHRRGDRIEHSIELVASTASIPLLRSHEGQPDEEWPASPPFQELDLVDRADEKPIAFLVGKAGTSHWSMSVELDPTSRVVRFDVACRMQKPPGSPGLLGSRYQSLHEIEMDDLGALFPTTGGTARLTTREVAGQTAKIRLTRPGHDAGDSQHMDIHVRPQSPDWPQTVQWSYQIAWCD